MKLSNNFSLEEMIFSQTAIRKNIVNSPTEDHQAALGLLCAKLLQPVRDQFGPVVLSSGYRSHALNLAIGGASSSQHSKGEAADFSCQSADNYVVSNWIANNLVFDQLILEYFDVVEPAKGWIHCSWSGERNRKEILIASKQNGRTVYENFSF